MTRERQGTRPLNPHRYEDHSSRLFVRVEDISGVPCTPFAVEPAVNHIDLGRRAGAAADKIAERLPEMQVTFECPVCFAPGVWCGKHRRHGVPGNAEGRRLAAEYLSKIAEEEKNNPQFHTWQPPTPEELARAVAALPQDNLTRKRLMGGQPYPTPEPTKPPPAAYDRLAGRVTSPTLAARMLAARAAAEHGEYPHQPPPPQAPLQEQEPPPKQRPAFPGKIRVLTSVEAALQVACRQWPQTLEQLCETTSIARGTAQRGLAGLKAGGHITVTGRGNRYDPYRYTAT